MFTASKERIALFILLIGIAVILIDFRVIASSRKARENTSVIENPEKFDEVHRAEMQKEKLKKEVREEHARKKTKS